MHLLREREGLTLEEGCVSQWLRAGTQDAVGANALSSGAHARASDGRRTCDAGATRSRGCAAVLRDCVMRMTRHLLEHRLHVVSDGLDMLSGTSSVTKLT